MGFNRGREKAWGGETGSIIMIMMLRNTTLLIHTVAVGG